MFPPLQLRWHPIRRAFLPFLRREPRTMPQGLTPQHLPRKAQSRPLGSTLSHTQRSAPLTPLFRALYLLKEPLPRTLGTAWPGQPLHFSHPARRCCASPSRGGCGPYRRGVTDHPKGRDRSAHFGTDRASQVVAAASAVLAQLPDRSISVRDPRGETSPVSYSTQYLTFIVCAPCYSLRSAHASTSESVLWPTPSEYADVLASQASNLNRDGGGGDGGGGDGGGRDRRRGGGSDGRDSRGGGSGKNHQGGSSHSSGVVETGVAWARYTAAREEEATSSLLGKIEPPGLGAGGWFLHLGPTLRIFGGGGSCVTSP